MVLGEEQKWEESRISMSFAKIKNKKSLFVDQPKRSKEVLRESVEGMGIEKEGRKAFRCLAFVSLRLMYLFSRKTDGRNTPQAV
jgi:orotate phosphoribosyltransferase-like protein